MKPYINAEKSRGTIDRAHVSSLVPAQTVIKALQSYMKATGLFPSEPRSMIVVSVKGTDFPLPGTHTT